MSDGGVREQWRDWARGQGIAEDRLEAAVDAALGVAGSGTDAGAAAARLAGGAGRPGDANVLRWALGRARAVREELGGLRPAGPVTGEALDALAGLFDARRLALEDALRPAETPPVPEPARPVLEPPWRPAPAPSPREFLTEHSILVLSGTGAFLLIVAAVLYEVYAIGELSGGLRFAGVLGLDLVFGAAGWACLRSRRMRVVGHTYVAIFALLAPLVCVAGYVFLGLGERGIGVPVAQLLTGTALTILYGALCWRLRSQAYGLLALAALPVAWLGGIDTVGPGAWHGPAACLLVAVYALAARGARAVPDLGERFAGRAALFTHGAAVLGLAVTAMSVDPSTWEAALAASLAAIGAGYLVAWRLTALAGAAELGLAALGLAWAMGGRALGLGGWSAVSAMALVPAYLLLGRPDTPLAAPSRRLALPAGLAATAYTAALWATDLSAGHRTAWWLPAALLVLGGAAVLHRLLTGQAMALLVAAAAASLAALAANAAQGGGVEPAAALLLALAAAWSVAAETTGDPSLRGSLRAGMALQALVPVLLVTLPPRAAAAALLASTALLVAGAWRTRTAAWLLPAAAVLAVDWYWLGLALLPAAPPSATALALLYSPLPVVLGLAGLALRLWLGRRWAWPLYAVAAALALAVPAVATEGGDPGLAGRALLAAAAVAYTVATIEDWMPAMVAAVLAGAAGLALALAGAHATPAIAMVALSALATAVYAGHLPWRWAGRDASWVDAHWLLGLAGSGVIALTGFTLPGTTVPRTPENLLAGAAVLAFAGLLVADARLRRQPLLDHAALVAASMAGVYAALSLGATDPQWFVAGPGLALLASGLALPHDRRVRPQPWLGPAATAAAAALLLGTTAAQAFADTGWSHTAWLVAEAVAAVLLGIATRSRVLVVAGAAAAGAGGVRALFVLAQQGLLFAAFGAGALFLLGLGAALAALRDHVRGPLGAAWRDWN